MKTHFLKTALILAILAAAGLWYLTSNDLQPDSADDSAELTTGGTGQSASDTVIARADSPFAVRDDKSSGADAAIDEPAAGAPTQVQNRLNTDISQQATDVTALQAPLGEQQFGELVAKLNNDPALLQQLLDEFRQETDPSRKQWLATILGAVGGEDITLLASELIFSGDNASRTLGMSLLQEIQPGNAQARDIVSGMLATEVEPDVLVDALTALSAPGDVDAQSRAYLSDQIAWLTTHQDDGVRSISLDILSRWSDDSRYTDVLLAGLDDPSEYVRSSAAYSLADQAEKSPAVAERLFAILRNDTEHESVKRAAILALRSMSLTREQQRDLQSLEKRLNTVPR